MSKIKKNGERSLYGERLNRQSVVKEGKESDCHLPPHAITAFQIPCEADRRSVTLKLRNAHFATKHNKSFKDKVHLCELAAAKSLDMSNNVRNAEVCPERAYSVAVATRDPIKSGIRSAVTSLSPM